MSTQSNIAIPSSMEMTSLNGGITQSTAMDINGGMTMNAYGVPQQQQHQYHHQQHNKQEQQQQMMMNMGQMNPMNMGSIAIKVNSNAMNPVVPSSATMSPGMQTVGAQRSDANWRIQLTREHRANLIAKIYNEMVRVSADPEPGIKLWMNVSWYELTLYKESRTQEEYINKIFTRLKSLRAQQTDMNAVMAAQTLPNQGMLSRLDFSYYNTHNISQRTSFSCTNGSQAGGFPGHARFGGPAAHSGIQQPQTRPGKAIVAGAVDMPTNPAGFNGASNTPQADKSESAITVETPAEYWRQHAALKSKYHDDVEKVHSAFKKYVDHMTGHDETEQKKKLRYLLSYVQLCVNILNEDKTTHAPRKIEELDKVYKYIVKIVNPYLKKLRTETDKRSFTPNANGNSAGTNPSTVTSPTSCPPASADTAIASSSELNGAMHLHRQQLGQPQPLQSLSLQQKQQQHLVQQRAQQMQQQQQRMQAQARQQQMLQQQHMVQQQKGAAKQNQAHLSAQQAIQANMQKQQQNGQSPSNPQQNQKQHQLAQQASNGQQQSAQSQQPTFLQSQPPRQSSQSARHTMQQQTHSQQHKIQPLQQQKHAPSSAPTSRTEVSSLRRLDDPVYGGMDSNSLLLMPSTLGPSGSSSGFTNYPNDLSPTNFLSMDLLDMEGFIGHDGTSSGSGASGQNNINGVVGNNTSSGDGGDSDLMFMEAL
ncbi:unnamed protein product [Peronospora belbahrii]|uniref:Mediator complex subunit 15 KIX domain-containing protein n=1 Tax=Peronospora belbahrii TaxID=622444 RepID=A0ABN8D1Y4_9STRA|nr:unnamed protein product [Peronospora belbahrii]